MHQDRHWFHGNGSYHCHDCHTVHDPRADEDMGYAVTNRVWAEAGMDRGFLCIQCLEKRLGRKLRIGDFNASATINNERINMMRMVEHQ